MVNLKKLESFRKKDNAIVRSLKESGTESNPVNTGKFGAHMYNVDCNCYKENDSCSYVSYGIHI